MTFQMSVLPCRGMLGSFARSSRMTIALVARTSMASLVSRSLVFASVAPFLMFLGMDVSSASMSRTSVTCLILSTIAIPPESETLELFLEILHELLENFLEAHGPVLPDSSEIALDFHDKIIVLLYKFYVTKNLFHFKYPQKV